MNLNRPFRFTLFSFVFLFGFIGFLIVTPVMKIAMIVLAVLVGVLADVIDNSKDRPFQRYNELHGHYKK